MGQHSQKISPLLFQLFSGGNIAMDRENADRGAHFVTEKAGAGLNRHHTAIAAHKLGFIRRGQSCSGQGTAEALFPLDSGGRGGDLAIGLADEFLAGTAQHGL